MKIHTNGPLNNLVLLCRVVAKMAGKDLEVVLIDKETQHSKDYKTKNPTGLFPLLETADGTISESMTIAKFLASGHATLLGTTPVERAQIDQWTTWLISGKFREGYPAYGSITGHSPIDKDAFKKAVDAIKNLVRTLDANLKGDWLVGSNVTVADIALAGYLSFAFQTILDGGFKKAAAKACAWFGRVVALPEFVSVFGRIRQCPKGLPQVVKAKEEPKKAAPKPAAAAKPAEEKKKDVNPLDALPPSPWNFFDFKTLYTNHKDKAGEGMTALKEQFDPNGYSFWYVHYEKYGEEGKVYYKFENLQKGFLQRFDHFRKHAYGKVNMIGEEPNLEIKGVFCFRGLELPQEAHDHPQFEYMQPRKMDINDAKDFDLIKEHWSAVNEGVCEGLKVQLSMWHK